MNHSKQQEALNQKWLIKYTKSISEQYPELMAAMNEKPFTVVETHVHPNLVADWNREGLLLSPRVARKHHRLSASEFLWIKMIEKLRQFNFSFTSIRKIKEELAMPVGITITGVMDDAGLIDNLVKEHGEEHRAMFETKLVDPKIRKEVVATFGKPTAGLNLLDILIMIALVTKQPVSYVIKTNDDGMIYSPIFFDTPLANDFLSDLMEKTHVSISITELLARVLTLAPIQKVSEKLQLVTEKEALVLEALRENDLVSVMIRFDRKNDMDFLEVTKAEKVDKEARLMELMLTNGYQDITVKTENGNIVRCENTRKLKLK